MSDQNKDIELSNEIVAVKKRRKTVLGVGIGAVLFFVILFTALSPVLFAFEGNKDQVASGGNLSIQDYFGTLQAIYQLIQQSYVDKVDGEVLIQGAIKGMFEALGDPFSMYLPEADWRSLTDVTTGEFGGLGLYINKQRKPDGSALPDGFIEVSAPIEGTPAYRAGLLSGDLIVEIDDKSTTELETDQAVSRLRGRVGTSVVVRIFRGKSMDFKVTLVREVIQIPTVKSAMIGDVAYVRLIEFTPKTIEQLKKHLTELKSKGYKSMIFDVRNNPGGVLDGAVYVADLFFSDGVLVSTKGRIASENRVFRATAGQMIASDVSLIVLINKGSASASEILAGALKDRNRALFVGSKTYGKGSVQSVRDLGASGFRLTIARYYTPADITIDKVGISPDVEIVEPVLSRDEELALVKIQEQSLVKNFVENNQQPSSATINAFVVDLNRQGLKVPERLIKRLIRLEVERKNNQNPVYDLEYDLELQKALEIIKAGDVEKLIRARPAATKTSSTVDTRSTLPSPRNP